MPTNLPADHVPLKQANFNGLYTRGVSDTTPDSFFVDCLNVKFAEGDVLTRDGLALGLTKSNIVRFWTYKRLNETPRLILLDTSGNLLDSLAIGTPIWTDADIVDFSMVNYNNRAYITVHNRKKGIAGKYILVYEGSGSARLAAGVAPSGFTLTLANSATSGNVESGYHIFGVCGLTSSGFITAPGPEVYSILNCTGGFKVTVSDLPVLVGSQWVGRVLVTTAAIPPSLYSGNPLDYEFFFVPNGTILDNSTTSLDVSFFDSDLVQSADYLFDNLSQIPAGVGIGVYNGRLVTWGEDSNEFTIRVSNANDPEVFSGVSGFINLDPSDVISGVRNCTEARSKIFLIGTSNRIYTTSDNNSDPNTWAVPTLVDNSVGMECFGVATVLDAKGNNTDRIWIATKPGLVYYDGAIRRPEMSYNIEDTWKRINKNYFELVQVTDDPLNHRIFVSVPLDGNTTISHILYGDYSKAFTVYGTLDEKAIKWAIWSFPSAPVSILTDYDSSTGKPILRMAVSSGNVYDLKDGLTDDYGNAIDSYIQTSLKTSYPGWLNHFGGLKVRVKGSGNLTTHLYGEDDTDLGAGPTIALGSAPGKEYDALINAINEKCSIKFRVSNFGEYFILTELQLFAKALWLRRPM